MHKPRRRV